MAKKNEYRVPSFLEVFQSQRVQVVTPKGGSHKDLTKYNRKEKHRTKWEG